MKVELGLQVHEMRRESGVEGECREGVSQTLTSSSCSLVRLEGKVSMYESFKGFQPSWWASM